jgi:hypothetical protein
MLTKEECLEALTEIKMYGSINIPLYSLEVIENLIGEHFSNPPLEWEEIQELKKGDIIWDNLNKKNLKINFIEVSRWGEKIIDGWLEGDIMSLVYLFEPNRFYRKEVQE